jgi:hypothetical protein
MREPKRVVRPAEALDDMSANMGELLRRADELLAEWGRFGAQVRGQVEHEAREVGNAVASAVDGAVTRATSARVDRAITDQIGARLAALAAEIGRLETRARAATRAVGEERRVDRRVLWVVAAGVVIANALLVVMLLRKPAEVKVPLPEPVRVEQPVVVPADAAVEPVSTIDAVSEPAPAPPADGSASKPKPGAGSATRPIPTKATIGPPAGSPLKSELNAGPMAHPLAAPPPHATRKR